MGYGQGSAGTAGTGFHLLIIMFMLLFGVSLGQLVASLSPSVQVAINFLSRLIGRPNCLFTSKVAVLFNPFIGLVLATFCGVTIPYPNMMRFWRVWLYQLDPYTRTLAAMVSTELQ
jgi:ABC-type multidrug transport system permease subunit